MILFIKPFHMYNVILMRRERERVNKKNTHTAELELQTADNLTCQQQSIYDVLCGPSFKSMIFSTSSKSAKQPNTVSKTQCVLPSDYQSRCFFYFFTSTSIISYIYIIDIIYIYIYVYIDYRFFRFRHMDSAEPFRQQSGPVGVFFSELP